MLGESSDSTDGTLSVTVGNNGNTMQLMSLSEISRSFNLITGNKSRMDNFCPIQKNAAYSAMKTNINAWPGTYSSKDASCAMIVAGEKYPLLNSIRELMLNAPLSYILMVM